MSTPKPTPPPSPPPTPSHEAPNADPEETPERVPETEEERVAWEERKREAEAKEARRRRTREKLAAAKQAQVAAEVEVAAERERADGLQRQLDEMRAQYAARVQGALAEPDPSVAMGWARPTSEVAHSESEVCRATSEEPDQLGNESEEIAPPRPKKRKEREETGEESHWNEELKMEFVAAKDATINDSHPTHRPGLAIFSLTPMSSPPPAPKPSPKKSPGSSLNNPFSVDDWSPPPTPLGPRQPPAPVLTGAGASIQNPLLVDSKGRIVDENGRAVRTAVSRSARPSAASRSAAPSAGPSTRRNSPTRRHIQIFSGPPSLINQDTPRMRLPLSAGAQSAREAAQRRARLRLLNAMQTQQPESSARTRPRHRSHTNGYCVPRFLPLTEAELYLTDARPPVKTTERSHHECSICKHVKSHPVIRRALENSWECALCKAPITAPPARNWDAEQAIAFDIPDFVDQSLVSYSWDGLIFPAPKSCVPVSP
ncbi:hypothetical protein DFH06DRAFT_1349007 [Mycena polygramma]|nr:hypothetical protein DFH06DRAFT_1349007 [Mycena polygramma]